MSISTEFPAAPIWDISPSSPADVQDFAQFLQGESDQSQFRALSALGILHAAQTYLSKRPELQEVTLVHNQSEIEWPTRTRQFLGNLSTSGYRLRRYPVLDDTRHRSMHVVLEGPLPSPDEVMAVPGLSSLRSHLAYHAAKGSRPLGFDYLTLSQEKIANDTIVLGFANPVSGTRLELELPVGPLKDTYPFPPPPLKPHTLSGWNL